MDKLLKFVTIILAIFGFMTLIYLDLTYGEPKRTEEECNCCWYEDGTIVELDFGCDYMFEHLNDWKENINFDCVDLDYPGRIMCEVK